MVQNNTVLSGNVPKCGSFPGGCIPKCNNVIQKPVEEDLVQTKIRVGRCTSTLEATLRSLHPRVGETLCWGPKAFSWGAKPHIGLGTGSLHFQPQSMTKRDSHCLGQAMLKTPTQQLEETPRKKEKKTSQAAPKTRSLQSVESSSTSDTPASADMWSNWPDLRLSTRILSLKGNQQ